MLRWILALAAICTSSALLGLGKLGAVPSTFGSLCLTVSALSAVLLIGSFEAYETQAVRPDRDDR